MQVIRPENSISLTQFWCSVLETNWCKCSKQFSFKSLFITNTKQLLLRGRLLDHFLAGCLKSVKIFGQYLNEFFKIAVWSSADNRSNIMQAALWYNTVLIHGILKSKLLQWHSVMLGLKGSAAWEDYVWSNWT